MNRLLLIFLAILFLPFNCFSQEKITYVEAFPNISFQYPVEIQNASDGSDRLFVVEQQGVIKVFENSANTSTVSEFLNIEDIVSFSSGQEIGLLGLAFHPKYESNGIFFVYHTMKSKVPGVGVEIVLAKYTVDLQNKNRANKNSKVEIFSFDKNQSTSNHNGGKIAFGPDGYLYVSVGDGGGGGDPMGNAQNLDNIFGSILRIDIDLDNNNPIENNPDLPNGNYEIPKDNPRVGLTGLDELYSWGIRNTWKFSFDNETLWGADVGQDGYEEINHIIKGGNYGWNRFEGNSIQNSSTVLTTNNDIKPIYQYDHSIGDRSITGGYVYNGVSENAFIKGKYIYADYVTGRVWALDYNTVTKAATNNLLFRTSGEYVSSFGLDESGEMYFSSYGTEAKIYKISGGQEPVDNAPDKVNGIGFWNTIENSTNGVINCMLEDGDDIYIGGSFNRIGDLSVYNLAIYNKKTGWKTTIGNTNGEVKSIAISPKKELVIGGSFSKVDAANANNIALWNGSSWVALGSGTDGPVAKIAIDSNGKIYAGGAFAKVNNIQVNNIAVWNNGWEALKEQASILAGLNNEVREIVISKDDLVYIGGNFDTAGDKSAFRIATWNGTNWGTLGNGTSGFVEAIAINDNFVYVGGNFNLANTETVNRIARWNLSTKKWENLGNGLSGSVNSISISDDKIFAAGNFVFASNAKSETIIVNNIAQWTELSGWQPLGENLQVGTNGLINSINFSDVENRLYIGGNFSNAGDVISNYFAEWSDSYICPPNSVIQEYKVNGVWASGEDLIELNEEDSVVLSILPNTEAFTITLPDGQVVNGDYSIESVTDKTAGIYTLETEKGCSATLEIKVISKVECELSSIIPQYRIENGAWLSFQSELLTIVEGVEIGLRLGEANEDYTIISPSNIEYDGEHILESFSQKDKGSYIFKIEEDCFKTISIQLCDSKSILPEFKLGEGEWVKGENGTLVDEGVSISIGLPNETESYTVTSPNDNIVSGVLTIDNVTKAEKGIYVITMPSGCSSTFELNVISFTNEKCTNELRNENELITLPDGSYYDEYLQVDANEIDVNNSPCSLMISSLADGRLWERYILSIDLDSLGVEGGETLKFSIDGKSVDGNARIEVAQNNKPNAWLLGHTFSSEWSTYSKEIVVPSDINSLDIWLYSNYAELEKGTSLYDNLIVEKLLEIEDPISTCENPLENLNDSIILVNERLEAGLDEAQGLNSDELAMGCVLEISNEDENQPWARYSISLNLQDNDLKPGDILDVSIDGKSLDGNARIEVAQNNQPNKWLLGHTFSNEWSTYSQQIVVPDNISTLDIWLFSNYASTDSGGSLFNNFNIEKLVDVDVPIAECKNELNNVNEEIVLINTRLEAGLDESRGIDSGNLEIGCVLEISNTDQNQPWARYSMTIDLAANDLKTGDELEFSLDGRTVEGNARIEVAQNNKPNAWQIGHNFTSEWSNFKQSIIILPGVETLDIWLFSNYAQSNETGLVQFSNLIISKENSNILLPLRVNMLDFTEDNEEVIPIKVYPNPTTNRVTVDISKYVLKEITLNLISPNNVILFSEFYPKTRSNTVDIDLSQYPPGVYLISITTEDGVVNIEKVIKM